MFMPEGIYAAMLTPFDERGRVKEAVIREMVEFYIARGVQGIFPVSNVGEHIQMSEEEKRRFVDIVMDQAKGRVKITPGISSAGTDKAIELGQYCAAAGADGVVLSAPYYFKYPQELVESHLEKVAKSLDIPVILYNIPLFANPITKETLKNLIKIDNIVAIKDSSGSIPELLNLLNMTEEERRDFRILVGWEEMLLSSLVVGASGCMVASGGIFPEIMTGIYRSFKNNQLHKAVKLQKLIALATEQMKKVFFPYGYKLAMEARGFAMGEYSVEMEHGTVKEHIDSIFSIVKYVLHMYDEVMEN
jgi:dihydrodipicolinate synthase/N-acetylneuraminate lyase